MTRVCLSALNMALQVWWSVADSNRIIYAPCQRVCSFQFKSTATYNNIRFPSIGTNIYVQMMRSTLNYVLKVKINI